MTAELDLLSAAKLWLTAAAAGDAPYLAAVVYALPTTLTGDVRGLAADDRWRLYANPTWVARTSVPAIGAELAHLCWHLLRDHSGRARDLGVGSAQAAAWRKAADATVSETMHAAGQTDAALPGPADLGLPPGRAAEEYYAMLDRLSAVSRDAPDGDAGDTDDDHGDCGSSADGLPRAYETADPDGAVDPTRADEIRRAVAVEFRGHMTGRGTEPGEWARWVQTILEPKVPWQQILSAAVRRAVGWTAGHTDQTYSRLSRRSSASPRVVFPGLRRPSPAVAVVVDTSASMDDGLLAQALGEIDGVLRSLGPACGNVTVLSCDAAVHTVGRSTAARDVRLVGGGGTDVTPGIDAAARLRPPPEVVVVLTDGFTPWPAAAPPRTVLVAAVLGRDGDRLPETPPWARRVECVLG